MKKIKSFMMSMLTVALTMTVFTSCDKDDDSASGNYLNNILSEYGYNDMVVAKQKQKSGKKEAVLLVAFGSTWSNAFAAFDATKKAYQEAFPQADIYVCFSSDICINRASAGENGEIRNYYEPRYLLHAIGAAEYEKIYVQSLQVIPGEEFANVVACVKKFMNNGYIKGAHLRDKYLAQLNEEEAIFLGMPLLNDSIEDVNNVAAALHKAYKNEAAQGDVLFMGHGNPDTYDTFKANVRYTQLEKALQQYSSNYFVGTVDMPNNYKNDVHERMARRNIIPGNVYLHALMSIAGDHAHNDMAGQGEEYWNEKEPASEENSWFEYFGHNGYKPIVTLGANKEPLGLLEIHDILNIWIEHTKNAEFLEDAYHSMKPED